MRLFESRSKRQFDPEREALVRSLMAAANNTYYGNLPYHNWRHVCRVHQAYKELYGTCPDETGLAIAYHDAIYVPGAPPGMNESMSALAFLHELRQRVVTTDLDKMAVFNMIEATKVANHVSPTYVPGTLETARVLDCDLSELAKAVYTDFVVSQTNILIEVLGREYELASHEQLCVHQCKQAAFLRQFLERPFIYHTAEARLAFEQTARANILKFVDSWS